MRSAPKVLSVTYGDDAPWPLTPDGFGFSLVPRQRNANPDPDNRPTGAPAPTSAARPARTIRQPASRRSSSTKCSPHTTRPMWTRSSCSIPRRRREHRRLVPDGRRGRAEEVSHPERHDHSGGGLRGRSTKRTSIPTPGTNNSFSLSCGGEQVYLFSGDANTNLTGYSHGFSFGGADGRDLWALREQHRRGTISGADRAARLGTNNAARASARW